MTWGALPFFYRPVQKFLLFKIFFNVAQRGGTQIVFVVAAQAGSHFVERQEPLVVGIVGRVAGAAATLLTQGFVRYLGSRQFFAYFIVAANAQIRGSIFEYFADRRSVRIVAGGAGAVFYRRMGDLGLLQACGEIGVAGETDNTHRSVEERLFF